MGPEMYVGYAKDWAAYDRLCKEYEGICSGCDRLCDLYREGVWREPVMRIKDAMCEFSMKRVTTDLPEAWREPWNYRMMYD